MKRWILLAVMAISLVGMCLMFDGAYAGPVQDYISTHTTEWINTPYCNIGCKGGLAINVSEIPESWCPYDVDIKQYLKARYYNADTWQELDLSDAQFRFRALLRNGQYTQWYKYSEIPDEVNLCNLDTFYTLIVWDRSGWYSDTPVEWIKEIFGVNFTQYDIWYPATATYDYPTGQIITDGTKWTNATIQDSAFNTVEWRIEYPNGTITKAWEQMIGHNESSAGHNGTTWTNGIFVVDGRVIYGGNEYVEPIYNAELVAARVIDDDLWGYDNEWTPWIGGRTTTCFKSQFENCTGTARINYTFISPVCDLWLWSTTTANVIKDLNLSYNEVDWWNDTSATGISKWYKIFDDVSGVSNGDGTYTYRVFIRATDAKYGIYFSDNLNFGGLKCVPQTNTGSGQVYQAYNFSLLGDGNYVLRLNVTNSTWDANTTITSNITMLLNPWLPNCTGATIENDHWLYNSTKYINSDPSLTVSGCIRQNQWGNNTLFNESWTATTDNYVNDTNQEVLGFYGTHYIYYFCNDSINKWVSCSEDSYVVSQAGGLSDDQNSTLYSLVGQGGTITQDVDIILGFFLFAGLCFAVAIMFQKAKGVTSFFGMMIFLFFAGMGIFVMSLGASAIYTGWNNTDTWNSTGMGIPDTMMNLSIWGVWVWVTLIVLGVLFWLMKWFAEYKGVKQK